MVEQFLHSIAQHKLLQPREPVLLAVSGGVDSVVMSHLFSKTNFPFGIAHCNFKLRENDSETDAQFVKALAASWNVPFFSMEFDTHSYSKEKGISVEMAARELRYEWLEKTRKENGYHKIATAHHRDDSIETVLLNLVKGTGISGLHGILPQRDSIIRPMLSFGKEEIVVFAEKEKLSFRHDHTNFESLYQRNLLRNEVIPKLKQLNPNFSETFAANIEKFKDAEALYKKGLSALKKNLLEQRGAEQFISIKKLLLYDGGKTILFELLRDFGFNEKQTGQIYDGLSESGTRQYLSENHRVIQHCGFLIIAHKEEEHSGIFLMENVNRTFRFSGGALRFHILPGAVVKERAGNDAACLDFDKLQLPLMMRKWKHGDYFYPQGMGGKKKKLSDFFTDLKLSPLEKERAWILLSGDAIVWIAGYRTDERFSVSAGTKKTVVIKLR